MIDRKKLALIHIVKQELGLDDESYRTILKREAGVTSAKDLDEKGFRALMNYLVRDKSYHLAPGGLTLKQKLFIQHLAKELKWNQQHLKNFIHKYYHKERLEELTPKEGSKLIVALKNIKERSG